MRLEAVKPVAGVAGGAGTSLRAEQRRQLHVRAICRRRRDGVKEIEQQLHRPLGSTFRFLSDEPAERGGAGAAPSAACYMAAGVAFCFMTQLGRYAAILGKDLSGYRIVQDTRFPGRGFAVGATASGPGAALGGGAGAVETHVYLDTRDGSTSPAGAWTWASRPAFCTRSTARPSSPSSPSPGRSRRRDRLT